MTCAITIGAGKYEPVGTLLPIEPTVDALATALSTVKPVKEAWWSPHTWKGNHRAQENWLSAIGVGVDIDYENADGDHARLPEDGHLVVTTLAQCKELPGNLVYLTPQGFRIVFLFDDAATDPAMMKQAMAGACEIVEAAMIRANIAARINGNGKPSNGLAIDRRASLDLARMFYTPHAIVKGMKRDAEVIIMREQAYAVADLVASAPAEKTKPKAPTRVRASTSDDLETAVGAWNRDNPGDYPSTSGTCPACGHHENFKVLPGDPTRWYCFSANHDADSGGCGRQGEKGWWGDSLDLEAHRRRCTPVEVLRQDRYLASQEPAGVRRAHQPEPEPAGAVRELAEPLDLADALLHADEPIPWAIDGLLARGETLAIVAEWGVGKSLLMLDLAFSLSGGHDFLTTLPILGGPYRVLVIDLENPERLMRHRVRKLAHGLSLDAAAIAALPIKYICQPALNLDDEADRDALHRAVEAFAPDFIFLDSLVRLHRGEENSNAEMRNLLAHIALLRGHSAGIIAAHHLSKPTRDRPAGDLRHRIRGASDIPAAFDEVWGLEKEALGFGLVHVKCRYALPASDLSVTIEDVDDEQGLRLIAAEKLLLAVGLIDRALADAGTTGVKRVDTVKQSIASGMTLAQAQRAVTREFGRRHARREVKKRGNRAGVTYWLTEHAPEDAE